ncbi:GNAT family acetyltransferase [Pseudomonas agarici]|uniref:GNAT family acetyltransferase n=1 Tax=Pseudomonas agarici TaxID=46677 RepID=A0A0X1T3B6_PSEAA|nr:GNAT family N-acetyltransferase [Pseudomonas agarici]AMB86349.1 GNAT family acetyltransferase [Pseudomonas agarici]NWB90392.1 GNAT family N-acetyltransferase [Pseudomonas agarici]NWC08709.1 GNAT family N-acetyltransferase [Pseudomonas agarici]SEK55400.1 Ribosomal protein S18 acetylase RimI [Pseudomonas agarici]
MSSIEIRPVTAADQAAWRPLWQAYLKFYETELPDTVYQSTWQRFLDPDDTTHAALAWQDGKAVGLVHFIYHRSTWSVQDSCYLQDLFVAPDVRGAGLGRLLIEHVYVTSAQAGCAKVHWLTHETNATAIQLYERIAERPGFIHFRKVL